MKITATERLEKVAQRKTTRTNHATLTDAHQNSNTPSETVEKLVKAIGYAAACETVAEQVNAVGDWDARISRESRQWAASVVTAANADELADMSIYSGKIHSAHVDQIAKAMAAYTPDPETEPEPEPETVSISTGNRKMGAIPSVSLPPVTTCAPGVPCAKKCYACKMCRIYPTVRAAYERNMRILRADPEQYFHQIDSYLKSVRFFRWHVSGDIPSAEYFENMVKCAINNPHCEQLAFTKQYDIVNDWIAEHGNLPKNLHVIFSLWDENWNTRVSNPHNLPCSAVIFRGQSADEYSNVCGGNCFECDCRGVGCWAMTSGETIAFYEH